MKLLAYLLLKQVHCAWTTGSYLCGSIDGTYTLLGRNSNLPVCLGQCEAYTPSSDSVYVCCYLRDNGNCRVYESATDGDVSNLGNAK
jgi:hypothetical protein